MSVYFLICVFAWSETEMVAAAGAIWREVSGREMEREAGRMLLLLVVVGKYPKVCNSPQ